MANDPRHPHVLVVDDDPDTRELYHIMLGSVGYGVTSAGTVRAGVDLARKNTPNVVLTDWRLPDGDGFSVADALREHYASRHVPLIAVTGVSMPAHKVADMRARGFTEVILKPASPDDILRAIRAATEVGTAYRLRAATRRLGRYASQASRHRVAGAAAAPAATIDAGRLLTRAAERSGNDITLMLADDSARYVAAAGSARELTGYEPQELVSLSVWDLAPPPEARSSQGLWQSFIDSGTQEGRYMLRRRDGAPVEAQYLRRRQRRPRPAPQRNCPRQSAPRRVLTGQRVTRKAEVFHHTPTDEVFLNDALRVRGRHVPVPRAFGVHHDNRSLVADSKTETLRSVARAVGSADVQLFHPALHVVPALFAGSGIDAVGADTDEQVTAQLADAEARRRLLGQLILFRHSSA